MVHTVAGERDNPGSTSVEAGPGGGRGATDRVEGSRVRTGKRGKIEAKLRPTRGTEYYQNDGRGWYEGDA